MKTHTAIALLFFSAPSFAVGPTDIHGFNDAGEEIYLYEDGEIPADQDQKGQTRLKIWWLVFLR